MSTLSKLAGKVPNSLHDFDPSNAAGFSERAYQDITPEWAKGPKWFHNYQDDLFHSSTSGDPFLGAIKQYGADRDSGKSYDKSFRNTYQNAADSAGILAAIFGGSELLSGGEDAGGSAGGTASTTGEAGTTAETGSSSTSLWNTLKSAYGYGSKGYKAYNMLSQLFGGGSGGGAAPSSGASGGSSGGGSGAMPFSLNPQRGGASDVPFFAQQLMRMYQPASESAAPDFSPLLSELGLDEATQVIYA